MPSRPLAAVRSSNVPVPVFRNMRIWSPKPIARHDDVEQPVAVEVLDDRAAGHAVHAEPDLGRHVGEARQRIGRREPRRADTERRRHPVGISAEGHVGDVQQPAGVAGCPGSTRRSCSSVSRALLAPSCSVWTPPPATGSRHDSRVDAVDAVLLLAPSQVDGGAQHQHVEEGFGADVGPGLVDLLEQAIGLRDGLGVTAGEEQLFGVDVAGAQRLGHRPRLVQVLAERVGALVVDVEPEVAGTERLRPLRQLRGHLTGAVGQGDGRTCCRGDGTRRLPPLCEDAGRRGRAQGAGGGKGRPRPPVCHGVSLQPGSRRCARGCCCRRSRPRAAGRCPG